MRTHNERSGSQAPTASCVPRVPALPPHPLRALATVARGNPYGSTRWKQLRLAVLIRDGGRCQIGGRRCRGAADTVHHILPSSTHPHLFFDPQNLQAACKPCNFGDGAVIRADNRTNRQLVDHYRLVEQQQDEIAELRRQLEERDRPRPHRTPAIR